MYKNLSESLKLAKINVQFKNLYTVLSFGLRSYKYISNKLAQHTIVFLCVFQLKHSFLGFVNKFQINIRFVLYIIIKRSIIMYQVPTDQNSGMDYRKTHRRTKILKSYNKKEKDKKKKE